MTTYELWDLDDGNRLGEFGSESDALAIVHDMLAESGPGAVSPLALLCIADDEEPTLVMDGVSLVARVSSQVRPVA